MATTLSDWNSVTHFDKETEKAIVKRLKSGDSDALAEIYERYKNPLMGSVNKIIKDPIESEDVVHETFIKFYVKINQYKGKARIGTYLYSMARNLAIDQIRKAINHQTDIIESLEDQVPPSNFTTPEQHVLNTEILIAFQKALKKFPKRTARLLEMYFIEQKSHKEISVELKITVGRSRSLLSENRKQLQEALQPLWLQYA